MGADLGEASLAIGAVHLRGWRSSNVWRPCRTEVGRSNRWSRTGARLASERSADRFFEDSLGNPEVEPPEVLVPLPFFVDHTRYVEDTAAA